MQAKNNFSKLCLFFLVSVFLVLFFVLLNNSTNTRRIQYIKISGENIKVSLAITKEEHARGLSGRWELAEGTGMLFIFDKPDKHYFWMKDMKFSIDIIWISPSLEVVHIERNLSPSTFPETYGPQKDSKYILEVNAGFSDKYGVEAGSKVEFTY